MPYTPSELQAIYQNAIDGLPVDAETANLLRVYALGNEEGPVSDHAVLFEAFHLYAGATIR